MEKQKSKKKNFTNDSIQVVFEATPELTEQVRRKVEELNGKFKPTQKPNDLPKIVVLRWGHRPQRDVRLTTHVALTARALCASGFILSDVEDTNIEQTVRKITARWGGTFQFEMGTSWKKAVRDWKAKGGVVVHLTAYGENIQTSDALNRIKNLNKDVLVLVGSQKVPGDFYSSDVSDFNVVHREPAPFGMRRARRFFGSFFCG